MFCVIPEKTVEKSAVYGCSNSLFGCIINIKKYKYPAKGMLYYGSLAETPD